MWMILLLKYSQVLEFRDELEKTKHFVLMHNVKDNYWGSHNGGRNMMGKLLMVLRRFISIV